MKFCHLIAGDRSIFNHLDNDELEGLTLVCNDFLRISDTLKDSLQVLHPGVGMFCKHLEKLKQLKKINFRNFRLFRGDIEMGTIQEIIRRDISLDVLDINLLEFKTKFLKELDVNSKLKKNLKTLKLNCELYHCLGENDLVFIENSFLNLE